MSKKIKVKRIDNYVIVVADEILKKKFKDGSIEEGFKRISKLVLQINSGLLSKKKLEVKKEKLLNIMINRKSKNLKEDSPLLESYKLAEGTVSDTERLDVMKRVATVHDKFEYDVDGYVFLKGHSVPIPFDLANAILDAHFNENSEFTVESLVSFWQWACLNPNPEAVNDLFGWFQTGDFSITPSGLIVAYRCVAVKKKGISNKLTKFVEETYVKIKKWKKSPKHYGVIKNGDDYEHVDLKKNHHMVDSENFKGVLADLYADLNTDEAGDVYTDNHTKKMIIKLGEEVTMPREDCDEERNNSCSRGLHFMSKKYNLRLGGQKLIVLINPMNIVAFPSYDNTKGRCCAYLPVAKALEDQNGDFEELGSGTYDFEYAQYTSTVLEDMIENVGLETLQEEGMISKSIGKDDLDSMQEHFANLLKDKLVYVS